MSQDLKALHDWIDANVPGLLASGEKWKAILNGGPGGDVIIELNTSKIIVPCKRQRRILEETLSLR